ncbi:MAG: glycosyltransferase family 39 protein, partial [Saprospiraceae bacterium]|nr:glycosyltransferase family 39 protein [Saprospiraceae bacterium]
MNYFSRSKTTSTESLIIFVFCVIKLSLHLIADKNSGFQADEFLHIETGKHLAFGYMEFPPLIGFLAFLQNLFQSNSIYVHHLLTHLAGILIIIYVAKTTIELGGKEIAIMITLSSIIIGPGFGRSQQLFQPVVFSQLFWVLNFYNLTRFVKYLDKKSLWGLTLFTFLVFSVKYDALFFVFGATSLLLFKRTREALVQLFFWKNFLVVLLLLTPNMIWQYLHHWPALQMFNRLYETQLDRISRLETLGHVLIAINPITSLLVVLPGVIYLSKTRNRIFQQLGIAILLS